jgi:hypothetical protein
MWNVTLAKNTNINERLRFRLEAQAVNFLNTPFFGHPNTGKRRGRASSGRFWATVECDENSEGFPPATAEGIASQRADLFKLGYALVVFNPKHDPTQPGRKLDVSKYAILSGVSRLRLGRTRWLGMGCIASGGLS